MTVSSRLDGTRAISDNAILADFEGIILRDAQISLEQGRSERRAFSVTSGMFKMVSQQGRRKSGD